MNAKQCRAAVPGLLVGGAVLIALAGCTTVDERPYGRTTEAEVSVDGGYVGVEIRSETDFYEPLEPYGRWEIVGSYGRCWIPSRVDAEWSPYADGYWRLTDAGWYWESEEPWGWATYHYGRWESDPQFGWYWVPQTRWAPAWVSWRQGGGYTGWAPLGPSGRPAGEHDRRRAASGGYVFVEDRQFLEPVRHQTVVVNNTVINRTVINEAPSAVVIEKASGRKVQATPVRELRRKEEAAAVTKHPALAAPGAKKAAPPARPQAGQTKPGNETRQAAKAPTARPESRRAATRTEDVRDDKPEPIVKSAAEKPAPKTDSRQVRKATAPKAEPQPVVPKKQVVRGDEPEHLGKPVVEKPAQPDEMRVPEQKRLKPAPAPQPTKAKDKRAPKPKTSPEVKAEVRPPAEAPAPANPPGANKKPRTDNDEDDEATRNGKDGRER